MKNKKIVKNHTKDEKSLDFKIEGGHKLSGNIEIKKSKNAAVGLLCASLLNKGKTTLKKLPKIEEVYRIIEVLESIGMKCEWQKNDLVLTPSKIDLKKINRIAAEKTRSVIMMIGPLIHHLVSFSLPHVGGCKLGKRIVSPHFYALENLGVKIVADENSYRVTSKKLNPAEFVLYEMGDTVTENVLMAAALIPGITIIKFASSNYMVQDLCHFLIALGVEIKGIGTSTLEIHGVKTIDHDIVFEMSEDPIEAMFFLTAGIVTKSSIVVERCPLDFLELELLKLKKMGFKYGILKKYKGENGFVNLGDIKIFPSDLVALPEKIHALPYPGINIDNLPYFVVIATMAAGETLIHDWVYENRAIYYTELEKLGASIQLADPHRVFIKGGQKLYHADIVTPPALRPAAIILIAMLEARGTSMLRNVYSINRGYEDLAKRLKTLGARIEIC